MKSGLGMGWKSNMRGSLLYDIFGEAAVEGDAFSLEVLTQDRIPASAVEAVVTLAFRTSFPSRLSSVGRLTVMLTSATQRSPTSNPSTSLPIATTFPIVSWPRMSWAS
jgi:hypothetical protein